MTKDNGEKEPKYRVAGWVTKETYDLMQKEKEKQRIERGLRLSQGMLIDIAFNALKWKESHE